MERNNFLKAKNTYLKEALIQQNMRELLFNFLEKKHYKNVLDIGTNQGEFAKLIKEKITFNSFDCLDINHNEEFFLNSEFNFICSDFLAYENCKKYDLIISNACLQWLDFKKAIIKIKKLANDDSVILLSTFCTGNLYQIKDFFNISLDYLSVEKIQNIIKKYFPNSYCFCKDYKLSFKSAIDCFRHLKNTGVTGFARVNLNKQILKDYELKHKNTLSYKCVFIIINPSLNQYS